MTLKKVNKGDKSINTGDFNRMVSEGNKSILTPPAPASQKKHTISRRQAQTTVKAKNENATKYINPNTVVQIVGQVLGSNRPDTLLRVDEYSESAGPDTFLAIAVEAIPAQQIGLVCIDGLVWCKFTEGTTGDYASAVAGSDTVTLGDSGPFHVIDTDGDRALLRFSMGSSGSHDYLPEHVHRHALCGI